ncbi:MAG: putative zinc-binding metallopeptidase [Agriterribacter sp.]
MKKTVVYFSLLFFVAVNSSCVKENFDPSEADNIVDLGGGTWAEGNIDKWINDSLITPYNISVKYKWDAFEDIGDITYITVPPKEEYVTPILSAVRKTWINPYTNVASPEFFNKISPKIIYMVGSPALEESGAIKLGVAEGGKKIILLAINYTKVKGMADYNVADSFWIKEMFLTIHHEFGHILHQNILYPTDFRNLNPSLITSNWQDYTDEEALRDGFITSYSMNTIDDDFVEMISHLLVNGDAWFEEMLASIPDGISDRGTTKDQAIARLRAKRSIVINYYKQAWNIDFAVLQQKVRSAVNTLLY